MLINSGITTEAELNILRCKLKSNGLNIQYIENPSIELQEIAINSNVDCFPYIQHLVPPERFELLYLCYPKLMKYRVHSTFEEMVALVKDKGLHMLDFLPRDLTDEEQLRLGAELSYDSDILAQITNPCPELCTACVEKSWYAINCIPDKLRTDDLYRKALENSEGRVFYSVHRDLQEKPELLELAVRLKWNNLSLIDEDYQTPEVCKLALEQDAEALRYVKTQTPELVEYSVNLFPKALRHARRNLITPEMVRKASMKDHNTITHAEFLRGRNDPLRRAAFEANPKSFTTYQYPEVPLLLMALHSNLEAFNYIEGRNRGRIREVLLDYMGLPEDCDIDLNLSLLDAFAQANEVYGVDSFAIVKEKAKQYKEALERGVDDPTIGSSKYEI